MKHLYTFTIFALAAAIGLSSCSSSKNAQSSPDMYSSGKSSGSDYVAAAPNDQYVQMKSQDYDRWSYFDDYNSADAYYAPAPMSYGYGGGFGYGFGSPYYGFGYSPFYGPSYGMGFGYLLRKHRYSLHTLIYHVVRALGGFVKSILLGEPAKARFYWNSAYGRLRGYLMPMLDKGLRVS